MSKEERAVASAHLKPPTGSENPLAKWFKSWTDKDRKAWGRAQRRNKLVWWKSKTAEEKRQALLARYRVGLAHPNKLEGTVRDYLNINAPGEWEYNTGDYLIAGLFPDFVNVNGRKMVIEVFGDYWHKGEDPAAKKRRYKRAGYSCVVVWEGEFYRDPSILLTRLLS